MAVPDPHGSWKNKKVAAVAVCLGLVCSAAVVVNNHQTSWRFSDVDLASTSPSVPQSEENETRAEGGLSSRRPCKDGCAALESSGVLTCVVFFADLPARHPGAWGAAATTAVIRLLATENHPSLSQCSQCSSEQNHPTLTVLLERSSARSTCS